MIESRMAAIEALFAWLLVGSSVVALATCASGARPVTHQSAEPRTVESAEADEGSPRDGRSPADSSPAERRVDEPASAGEHAPDRGDSNATSPLAPFWEHLSQLSAGKRREPVRVLWLGDSHTAADFMTDAVRQALQSRYGGAGAGFVRLGVSHYRHARARVDIGGKWRRLPQQPSRRSAVLDGVFGLCGMRAVPEAKAFASARLHGAGVDPQQPVQFTLMYRLPGTSALQVRVGDRDARLSASPSPSSVVGSELGRVETIDGSPISRFVVEGRAGDEFRIDHVAGSPEVFGLTVDLEAPGVIVDTCGIDGARVATVLAWQAEAWQAEVRARRPELAVLAYGTNEAFDEAAPWRYAAEYGRVMALLRGAVADLPCWIVGPPDVWDRAGRATARIAEINDVQRRAAAELGCGFVSARELMGGAGSFSAWREATPQLARADGVHLSREGYEKLGAALGASLLAPSAP